MDETIEFCGIKSKVGGLKAMVPEHGNPSTLDNCSEIR